MVLKFKNKWDCLGLFNICSSYLQDQREVNALSFLGRVELYIKTYCEEVE